MIKQTITYDDYNGESVTEDFYFNFDKLEILELELKYDGGLDQQLVDLTKTSSGKDAYYMFKDIVLSAYGKKSADGRKFEKSDEIRQEFESSPALSELILSFLKDVQVASAFVEGCLPAKLVAQVKADAEKMEAAEDVQTAKLPEFTPSADVQPPEEPPAASIGYVPEGELARLRDAKKPSRKDLTNMTRKELLAEMQKLSLED